MTKPLIYTILVALLLAGGVWWGVTYYSNANTTVQNTNNGNWLTYADERSFSFVYPRGWTVSSSDGELHVYPSGQVADNGFLIRHFSGNAAVAAAWVDAIQTLQVTSTTPVSNDSNRFEINITHEGGETFKDLAVELNGSMTVLLSPYKVNPDSGFPASLELQQYADIIAGSIQLKK